MDLSKVVCGKDLENLEESKGHFSLDNNKVRLANRDSGPISFRINDEELLETLKKIILDHWQITDERDFFPAPQPVSLERRDLSKLIEYEYLVCAKSDGMRFLLICYGGSSYMVDRAFKIYKINLNFKNNELYNSNGPYNETLGGIFDGELVANKQGKWQYVIHDCINIYGKDISKNIFPARYSEIVKLTCDYWISEGSEFRITSKQFFPFRQLGLLNRLIQEDKLDHKTDGIICTPKNKKVGSHTQYDLFKWKPRHLHTFDFKIIKNQEGITAYVNKNGVHVPYASAPIGSQEEKLFIEGLNKNCSEFVNGNIVECDYNDVSDIYTPIKLRLDKSHPNSFFTVKKTLCNIKENISMEELIEMIENHS
jgi:mRNA guanylyltransferase